MRHPQHDAGLLVPAIPRRATWAVLACLAFSSLWYGAARSGAAAESAPGDTTPTPWISLFDGQSLGDWKSSNFGGEGEVSVQDKRILLEFGDSLTGIVYTKPFPKQNYEIRLEAMRLDGIDFFCGLTFPVAESHCSLIVGGWAGVVVGLSNIDGRDASENETRQYRKFDENRWYRIRVRVTAERIRCWIDDQQVIDQDLRGRRISTRPEVEPSKPLGIAAWQTKAALRGIEYRRISP
jgi:3-keto-disaccharide hydrolase